MNRVKILFFATLREQAGGRKFVESDLPDGTTVRDLKASLETTYPGLKASLPTVLVAVNHEYAADETVITAAAEVALFPPVSGG
jgi:sulfur-carrier protein